MFEILVYLDTSCVNANRKIKALNELDRLKDEGKVLVEVTDTFETELRDGKGYPRGLRKALDYIFSEGPAVVNHSRLNSCIIGSGEDERRLIKVLGVLFGAKPLREYTKNEIRDAMHISTAIRYGGTYFVTLDKKVLNMSDGIRSEFQIIIANPENCLKQVKKRLVETFEGKVR